MKAIYDYCIEVRRLCSRTEDDMKRFARRANIEMAEFQTRVKRDICFWNYMRKMKVPQNID